MVNMKQKKLEGGRVGAKRKVVGYCKKKDEKEKKKQKKRKKMKNEKKRKKEKKKKKKGKMKTVEMMVMKFCNVIHSAVIIHAATTSLNVSKKSVVWFFILICVIICHQQMMGFQEALGILRRRPHVLAFEEINLHV